MPDGSNVSPAINDRDRALELVPALREIESQLVVYEDLLRRWQMRMNLVGRSTLSEIWTRHFADSGQLLSDAAVNKRWADLGSGAGFPGLVLSLLQGRNEGEMHLIESDTRKAAFLREVSRETGSRAVVHNSRVEDVIGDIDPSIVTSRAMADIAILFRAARPFVEKGGAGLFLKGRDIAAELTRASIPSNFAVRLRPSKVDPASSVVLIERA
jgi:16S rRNA (guanine527-N7)-methyltransferase